jgi:hypothetical protein
LRDRLRAAAPGSGAVVELGLGRMRVIMTFDAADAESAVGRALKCAAVVIAARPVQVDVEPAPERV